MPAPPPSSAHRHPPPTLLQPAPRAPAPRRRLWWHRLIFGLWYRPVEVLDEARDRSAWSAAVLLSLISGGIGVVSMDAFHTQWAADPNAALQLVGLAEAGVLTASLVLGAVAHAIARTLGGIGRFAPTASLFIVLFWVTDLPRLAIAAWLPTDATFVQAATWTTWGFGYLLAVLLIRGQHHLPTWKSTAAVSVQMLTALALLRLSPGS
ncbi:Yip1 family protein [Streptomyces kronopolitis]|uniref:Yip1 family protein n=1 Tax=Streptomyces kronopolitis TaxID=1612435 RepID=UPI0036892C26